YDRQLNLTLLNVTNRVRVTALREDDLLLSIVLRGPPPGFRKVRPELEWRVPFLCHEGPSIQARVFAMTSDINLKLAQWLRRSQPSSPGARDPGSSSNTG